MKRSLLLIIIVLAISSGYAQTAQILMAENFTGYTNGNLNGQGGFYPWTTTGNTSYVQVAKTPPLLYPNYTSGTQFVNLTQKADYLSFTYPFYFAPDDPYKKFIGNTTVSLTTNTSFYMSFVVRVPAAAGTAATNLATPTLALMTSNGNNLANFYIADNGSNLKFGIFKDGTQNGSYASSNYSFGGTYLVVLRYDLTTGSTTNDKMYMWINPSLASEPSTASADVTITSGNDGGFSGNINAVQLFQDQYSATASLDAIKLAYARNFANNSLAAWNALSPVGAPLPVTFGDIKGYSKDKGIEIDWTVYTELNVDHYEVERSSDGVSFSAAGTVMAQRRDGTLYYSWFDAAPLAENNFYRIRNLDMDGRSTLSPIIRVALENVTGRELQIYPNPIINKRLSFQLGALDKGIYKLEVFSMEGKKVYEQAFTHSGAAGSSQSIQLPAAVKTGIYTIRVSGATLNISKAFLVQ